MIAYRYNCNSRTDRKFNNCGIEKNPNAVRFYASNMDYAARYQFIHDEEGNVVYECKLEVTEVSGNLFDMAAGYASLSAYRQLVDAEFATMRNEYSRLLATAKNAKERKMFESWIANIPAQEANIAMRLRSNEFQYLSDFELQNTLVAELKSMGFDGYFTKNEIAIF
jgi:hypothetical protein